MKLHFIRRLLPFALALCVQAALAQGAADATKPAPKADVPPTTLEFNSTFTGYRAYTEQAVGSWRDANDEVGRIGGWRAYAKEAAPAAVGAGGAAEVGSGVAAPGAKPGHEHHGSPAGKP